MADLGLAADIRHRHPVSSLLENKRLLGIQKIRGLLRVLSSRATRLTEIAVPGIAARHSNVKSSTMLASSPTER